jgi:hypothetical protein
LNSYVRLTNSYPNLPKERESRHKWINIEMKNVMLHQIPLKSRV